jgi:rhomboid family GlyGly-CTERM serine protease
MGLRESNVINKPSQASLWLIPAVFIAVSVAIMLAGEPGKELLRYDRVWIGQGETWRLLSGHFAHLSWSHLGLNSVGLVLVWYLIGPNYDNRTWVAVTLVVIATIDSAFWFMHPELYWYVGMSGMLHGLLVAGIATRLRSLDLETAILLLLLVAKIGYEQFNGPVPGSETTSGGPVVVDAHLYGALGGALGALFTTIRAKSRASI